MSLTNRLTPSLTADAEHDDIIYPDTIPFLLVHLTCFAAFWSGVTLEAVVLCILSYVFRMFVVTAGYHRYFSHRSFKTSRVFQFILAFLAQTSAQRGILWWAAKHRHHHRHSDTELDVHSPRHKGFWYSHVGWIFTPRHDMADFSTIPDLTKYPELRWLDRNKYTPAALLALVCFLWMGWPGLVVGFFWSTVLLYHGSFMINSLAHVFGRQRYVTGDDSRNNWFLAIFTLGEGWHNNHHAYQRSTRQGFRWYEFDGTFYGLKLLSWFRIVWDLGEPPKDLVRNEHRLGQAVIEKVALQLAHTFPIERIAAQVRDAWANRPAFAELKERVAAGQARAEQALHELHLPHIPTPDELREQFRARFGGTTPSREEIIARARELIVQAIGQQLFAQPTLQSA
ncbi:MAG TPA: fatty acid desaturase [Gemmatimonadaceae bacterium]|nr:fatty acid desaturase [Gemmatimonadaceae bacterium]